MREIVRIAHARKHRLWRVVAPRPDSGTGPDWET